MKPIEELIVLARVPHPERLGRHDLFCILYDMLRLGSEVRSGSEAHVRFSFGFDVRLFGIYLAKECKQLCR